MKNRPGIIASLLAVMLFVLPSCAAAGSESSGGPGTPAPGSPTDSAVSGEVADAPVTIGVGESPSLVDLADPVYDGDSSDSSATTDAALPLSSSAGTAASTANDVAEPQWETATFAGGCFWCMEAGIQSIDGIEDVVSGFTGGSTENPTYYQVASGSTGHFESVQITYDPAKISYEQLLGYYWKLIDPTDAGGQFADRGSQYRTAIFYHDELQKELAEKSKLDLENSGKFDKPIATLILPFDTFYPAEEYHQDYFLKNPDHFQAYEWGSGRGPFLEKTWH